MTSGGRFDFDDGGTYCGGWEDGKAHGSGVCTGPKGQGEYAGAWHCGFEISGVYRWTTGNNYKGQWTQGKRHGVGVETKGRWIYQGEWTQGFKGRYGVRQSSSTGAKYEGTWTTGLQDGYGVETYADGGTYQGQWLRGIRHGYGLRQSVPYGLAAHCRQKAGRESLTSLRSEQEDDHTVKERDRKMDEIRGGFVLTSSRSADTRGHTTSAQQGKKRASSVETKSTRSSLRQMILDGLRIRKQRSAGDMHEVSPVRRPGFVPEGHFGSLRSTRSNTSYGSSSPSPVGGTPVYTDSNASFVSQDDATDVNVIESYTGEWKNDKRSGFGVSERSDGLKYEGEWDNNKRHGYGATTFRDGTVEEGKYKNNVLVTSGRKSKLLILRTNKLRDRVENAIHAAQRASQIAIQKSDIAVSRMASARAKAELAIQAATKAQADSEKARKKAVEYAPDFFQTGLDAAKKDSPPTGATLTATTQLAKALQMENHSAEETAVVSKQVVENHNPMPLHQTSLTAKSFLSRVAKGVAGVDLGLGGSSNEPRPMTTIGSALISVGLDTSLVKSLNPKGGHLPNALPEIGQATTNSPLSSSTPYGDETNHKNPTSKFSQFLDPALIGDHFDQYETSSSSQSTFSSRFGSTASGRNRSHPAGNPFPSVADNKDYGTLPEFSYDNPRVFGSRTKQPSNTISPDSGVDTDATEQSKSRSLQLQRRKTLPAGLDIKRTSTSPAQPAPKMPPQPTQNPTFSYPHSQAKVESPLRKAPTILGSLPDVAFRTSSDKTKGRTTASIPREEVHLLSLKRREEIRKQREEEERRKQQELVLRFGDVKDWCQQRQLLVFLIAINVGLAAMFFNLLAR